MRTLLDVKQLSKRFDDVSVLENISFKIEEGEFVAIMGPSGSGKSTLLYCMSGMDHVDMGEVLLNDMNIANMKDQELSQVRLKNMGFIFQQSHLLKNLSIQDNIALPGLKANLKTRHEVNETVEKLMKKTGIWEIADHDIRKVSGGQLQRAAICRALVNEPDIIFADEPTGALNSRATVEVMDILRSLNSEGKTLVLVTHDVKVAAHANRILFIMDGNIKAQMHFQPSDVDRNKILMAWLEDQGF